MSVPRHHRSLAARLAAQRLGLAAAGPAEPGGSAAPTVFEQLERYAKAIAVLLGALYVVGLLVSNAQLLRLGISDFSLLQAKSIATGVLFFVYLCCVALLIVPPAAALVVRRHWPETLRPLRWRPLAFYIGLTLLFEALLLAIVSSMYGALLPWGLSLDPPPLSWSPLENLRTTFARFPPMWRGIKDLVLHQWVLFPLAVAWLPVFIGLDAGLAWMRRLDESAAPSVPATIAQDAGTLRAVAVFSIVALTLLSPYVIGGFSRDVYPNLVQSMGGGQPDVIQFQPAGERLTTFVGVDACCYPAQPEPVVLTEPLVVWHESDKFLYVTPLPKTPRDRQSLVALDVRAVRAIQYLPKAVRIGGGAKVLEVFDVD